MPRVMALFLCTHSLCFTEEEEVGVWEEVDEEDEVPVHINVSSPGDFL